MLLDRVRQAEVFAAKGLRYHLAYARWRLVRWRGRWRPSAASLSDSAFFNRMDLARPELQEVNLAVVQGDYRTASKQLWKHMQARCLPRLFFAAEEVPALCALIPAEQQAATVRQAEAVCQNIYQFRRSAPVRFAGGIDWDYVPDGNVDWNWDLNRHVVFDTLGRAYAYTGDEHYARQFRTLVIDWSARNPPHTGRAAWSSVFEVAIRINTWLWALAYFRRAEAFDVPFCRLFLEGLVRHGEVLDAQLEHHAANNHLLLEAKALAMLGLALPELARATRWRERGLRLFFSQVRAQVGSDGVHCERVTHYQRAIAGELLELAILLEDNGRTLPDDIRDTLSRMVEFELWVTKPDGVMPLFGDSGLSDTHLRFPATAAAPAWLGRPDLRPEGQALSEADIWLLGARRVEAQLVASSRTAPLASRAFPAGGYYTMRHGVHPHGDYLVLDAGPFGSDRVPVHGHADALNIELYAYGQTFLIDPGGYGTWVPAAWRNYFRGTRAHNTVVVDEQDQSVLLYTRGVYRPARVTVHHWLSCEHFDLIDASHNGYERLSAPVRHRRQVVFVKPRYWVVIDVLTGKGEHTFDLYFHFMPEQRASMNSRSGVVQVESPDGPRLSILPAAEVAAAAELIAGATEPIQGWVALHSGEKRPAPVLRYRYSGCAPVQFCTVLYPWPAGPAAAPLEAHTLECQAERGAADVTALRVITDEHDDLLVIDRAPVPTLKRVAGQISQARMLYVRKRQSRAGEDIRVEVP